MPPNPRVGLALVLIVMALGLFISTVDPSEFTMQQTSYCDTPPSTIRASTALIILFVVTAAVLLRGELEKEDSG